MRLACPEERQDSLPIAQVNLNVNCRDEIIPILRALQHVYGNVALRDELLQLVGEDVNQTTSRQRGRRGLNYWEITVLAAARLGCNGLRQAAGLGGEPSQLAADHGPRRRAGGNRFRLAAD